MVQRKTGVGKLIESKQNQDSSRVNLEEQAKGRQLVGEARSRLPHTGGSIRAPKCLLDSGVQTRRDSSVSLSPERGS